MAAAAAQGGRAGGGGGSSGAGGGSGCGTGSGRSGLLDKVRSRFWAAAETLGGPGRQLFHLPIPAPLFFYGFSSGCPLLAHLGNLMDACSMISPTRTSALSLQVFFPSWKCAWSLTLATTASWDNLIVPTFQCSHRFSSEVLATTVDVPISLGKLKPEGMKSATRSQ